MIPKQRQTNKLSPMMIHQMFKLVLEKAEEPEIKLPTSAGSLKKQESSTKTSISALLTMPKPLTVWITTNCGKLWKRWEYQTTWPASWETYMQVRKQRPWSLLFLQPLEERKSRRKKLTKKGHMSLLFPSPLPIHGQNLLKMIKLHVFSSHWKKKKIKHETPGNANYFRS